MDVFEYLEKSVEKQQYIPKWSAPNNWHDISNIGSKVKGTKIYAMKTFLDKKYRMRSKHIWNENSLKALNLNIETIIDLTNTKKYYTPSVFEVIKLPLEGFTGPPTEEQVNDFIEIMKELKGNVAVHCTHGLNRTGFMIVSYLVIEKNKDLEEAIAIFNKSRFPGLVKPNYIEELYKRFKPDAVPIYNENAPFWSKFKASYQKNEKRMKMPYIKN
jgi:protein-tyrosine phosphatase